MNILIDIGHPAHVHLLKNVYHVLISKGHKLIVTVKDIAAAKLLMDAENIEYIEIGSKSDLILAKIFSQVLYNIKMYKIVKENKIVIGIGSSITLAHISVISKMKSIILDDDDDDVQPLFVKYAHPFADAILSPNAVQYRRKSLKAVFYPGYHELAYLHPKRFTPIPSVLDDAGLSKGERFFILRFNVFKAHHDSGISGLTLPQKLKLISCLKSYGKIFITTERDIEPELMDYQLKVPIEKIHSLIYYACMLIGDSQTMTSESAVLGTPSIRLNSFVGRIAYLEEEEHKYGLTYGFSINQYDLMLEKVLQLLERKDLQEDWQRRQKIMLHENIDVTALLEWVIENYPTSYHILQKNYNYSQRFILND
jgi:uncharacterized protein